MSLEDLTVYQVPVEKIRVGNIGDGGYVLVPSMNYDFFLSGGLSNNIEFENAFLLINPGLECHGFDKTIEAFVQEPHPGLTWFKKNIGGAETAEETNLHKYFRTYKDMFVKMDIEGGEYAWLASLSDEQLCRMKQLVIEAHWPLTEERWATIYTRLAKTHFLVHVHGNNNVGCSMIGGRALPDVLELTYVRRSDWLQLRKNTRGFPHEGLDYPNYSVNPEHGLRGYPFEWPLDGWGC